MPCVIGSMNSFPCKYRPSPPQTCLGTKSISISTLFYFINVFRIVWASSPSSAAELFVHFKFKREEPDLTKAVEAGKDQLLDSADNKNGQQSKTVSSNIAQKLVSNLPGLSSKYVQILSRKRPTWSFRDFCKTSANEKQLVLESKSIVNSIQSLLTQSFGKETAVKQWEKPQMNIINAKKRKI